MTDRPALASRLVGARALITGAGDGIGRAIALRLGQEGASVGVIDIRRDAALSVVKELRSLGCAAFSAIADVGSEESIGSAVAEIASAFGGLDTVVTSAGIAFPASTAESSLHDWETILRVNLTGVFLTVRQALPYLIENGAGAIVTIGSIASLVAAGNNSAYEASKGGVLQFTRAVAIEYVNHGIRANCVCPGLIQTSLGANSSNLVPLVGERTRPLIAERISIPMKGRAAPGQVAAAVAYLCSSDAAFVTGIALPVDGGYSAV